MYWLKLFCKTFWLRLNHTALLDLVNLTKFATRTHIKTTIHKKSPFATSTLLYNTHKSGYRWLLCAASLPEPPNSIASPPPHGPCAAKAAPKTPIHFPVFLFSPRHHPHGMWFRHISFFCVSIAQLIKLAYAAQPQNLISINSQSYL